MGSCAQRSSWCCSRSGCTGCAGSTGGSRLGTGSKRGRLLRVARLGRASNYWGAPNDGGILGLSYAGSSLNVSLIGSTGLDWITA